MRVTPNRHALSLEPGRQRLLTAQGQALAFPTDGSVFSLGSADDCVVRAEGPHVQPHHAQGQWKEGSLWVRANDNGATLVNGEKIKDWTPMGDGSHLQMGEITDPALSLAIMSGQPPQGNSDKSLLITFFGDASMPDIGKNVKIQPGRFEKLIAKSQAPVHVSGLVANGGAAGDVVHTALPWVMGAMSAVGAATAAAGALQGPISLPLLTLGGLMAVVGGFSAWASWDSSKQHLGALKNKLTQKPELTPQWTHVAHKTTDQGPRASQFEQLWRDNLQTWPNSRHIVYLSGHGFQRSAAGLPFDKVAATVKGAEAIVLDVCNGGQLEALSQLTGSARVAVASEHTVRAAGFPLESMFGHTSFPTDSRELAESLVRSGAKGRPAQSLVAVDLEAMQKQLLPSLDRLGKSLLGWSQGGRQEALREAIKSSETTDAKQVDLGSFLTQLASIPSLEKSCPELARTTQALNQTVVAMTGHGSLSFDLYPPAHMPSNWRQFLRQHR